MKYTSISAGIVIALAASVCMTCTTDSGKEISVPDRMKAERSDDAAIEKRIDDLLREMTLEEKIGQMTQINSSQIVGEVKWDAGSDLNIVLKVDTAKLGPMLRKYHVGSFLNGQAVPAQEWYDFYKDIQELNLKFSRLKLPIIYGIDHMHGPNYLEGGTIFPHGLNIAATYNNKFPQLMGKVTARETADLGHQWLFAPVLDLARTPLWGRMYETLGESPYVASTMGSLFVRAVQEEPSIAPYKIAATAKHFFAYSDPKSGWDRTPTDLSDQTLYEMHLPPFRAAIEAGIETVMLNSGEINGIPVHASYDIVTKLLRDELNFKGVVVTDWEDIIRLYRNHKVAHNEREATLLGINAGIDVAMTPYTTDFADHLLALVKEGKVAEERINLSVARILRLKLKLGLFENPLPRNERFDRIGTDENRGYALEAARESIVLMRNHQSTLPLDPGRIKNILVAGPLANLKAPLAGGWTLRWINTDESLYPSWMTTPFTAMQKEFGADKVSLSTDIKDMWLKSARADAIVVVVGENSYSEGYGSIVDLDLPSDQMSWIRLAVDSGKPVVLVMVSGRPRIITSIYEQCGAVLFAGWPGFEGATAIAEIISGKVNPSGKLSFNYPYAANKLVPYNYKWAEVLLAHEIPNPMSLAEFGSGLSYTTFTYSNLRLSDSVLRSADNEIRASVTVTNSGNREGMESVLWFISDEVASITRPVRELKYYDKKALKPGESADYEFVIKPSEHLWFPDRNNNRILEDGYFTLAVGNQSTRFKLQR
jgi:beta-glucosidase